jgi:UDP-N-acetylglucosamine 4,6-dehydratase
VGTPRRIQDKERLGWLLDNASDSRYSFHRLKTRSRLVHAMAYLDGKSVLVTGGTGSFGKALVKRLLKDNQANKIIVFSRDELKQFEMQQIYSSPKLSYVLGDVRDFQRLSRVTTGVDVIIHAAAMKQIPAAEANPIEAIRTNVIGAENIVNASIENGVSRVLALSTDKAANPANLYGATKLCSDKLMVGGNILGGENGPKFSVVRYGNVLGSRGSVIPFFKEMAKSGSLPITDFRMTRFWLTIQDGVEFVLSSLEVMHGGEIFVPKIPSFKVTDVASVVCPNIPQVEIGIRPGEKLHEIMITEDDANYTYEFTNYYTIVAPNAHSKQIGGVQVPEGFRFSSDSNAYWHTEDSFRSLLMSNGLLE